VTADPPLLVGLRCPISETRRSAAGVEALAMALGDRAGVAPRLIGEPTDRGHKRDWATDLREGRGCLLEAGGQVDDALSAGTFPVLVHGDCSVGMTTLPAVARHRPDVRVLWLDAHGDFNTPETTPSGWLGGMGLAGACGRWDPDLRAAPFAAERVVLCGVRELDAGERTLLQSSAVTVVGAALETLVYLQNALDGAPVFVHLDPDVLDPSVLPAELPVGGGLSEEKLYDLLEAVADACEVVGFEVASFYAPEDPAERAQSAARLADCVAPLLPSSEVSAA
jgi:arginase family enzyme